MCPLQQYKWGVTNNEWMKLFLLFASQLCRCINKFHRTNASNSECQPFYVTLKLCCITSPHLQSQYTPYQYLCGGAVPWALQVPDLITQPYRHLAPGTRDAHLPPSFFSCLRTTRQNGHVDSLNLISCLSNTFIISLFSKNASDGWRIQVILRFVCRST